MSVMKYKDLFNDQFQIKLLSLLVREKDFLIKYDDVIQPSYFTDPNAKLLAKIVQDYFLKFKEVPTYQVIDNELEKKVVKHPHKDLSDSFDLNKKIFTADFEDSEYVKEEAIKFAQKQALQEALLESGKIWNSDGDFDSIKKHIDDALKVGLDKNDLGEFYIKGSEQRLEDRLKEEETVPRIALSFSPTLNSLCSGGMGPEELWIILAATNRGKSSFLMNMAFTALQQNKKVVYYSFEMTPRKLMARLDSRMGRVPTKSLKDSTPIVAKKIEEHMYKYDNSEIVVKFYPRGTASVNTLISHLSLLEGYYDFKPDLIVVDYGDIMRPIDKLQDNEANQAAIYGELFYLAQTQHLPVITACQSNRTGLNKETVDLNETGESFKKVCIADVVLSLNETKEEYEANKSRIFIAKNRDDKKWQEIQLTFDRSTMYINEEEDDMEVNSVNCF